MTPELATLDRAIRDQHATFHSHVMVLQELLMRSEATPLRAPLHQTLVAMYRLIDVVSLGNSVVENSDVDEFGGIPRGQYPGILSMLSYFAGLYERMLKVDRGLLLGDAM